MGNLKLPTHLSWCWSRCNICATSRIQSGNRVEDVLEINKASPGYVILPPIPNRYPFGIWHWN